jgi:dihydrofolate synthase / folylpolyglutamate synthase
VILDSSHNAEGAKSLDERLRSLTREFGRAPIVAVGALGISRARPLLSVICRHAATIHLIRPDQKRACTHEELAAQILPTFRGTVVRDTVDALFPKAGVCTAGMPGEVVVVTGSIYLAGEVLSRIDPSRGPHEGYLQDF